MLVLTVIGIGFNRARILAKEGDPVWFALISFGCSGLIFDGQTICSLTSNPKFETLILWFPLAAASAIYYHRKQSEPKQALLE